MNNPRVEVSFTPTEQRILLLLSDGRHHLKTELKDCLNDDLQSTNNIGVYIHRLRKKLHKINQDLACEQRFMKSYVRLVRVFKAVDDE